ARRRPPRRGLLLGARARQGQGDEGGLLGRGVGDAAARVPLAEALREGPDLSVRRPRRPGCPALAAADRRAGRVRRDDRHPRRRARGSLGEDRLTLAPGEATPWWIEEALAAEAESPKAPPLVGD